MNELKRKMLEDVRRKNQERLDRVKILERRNQQIKEIPEFLKSLPHTVYLKKYNQQVYDQDYNQLKDYMNKL